MWAKTLLLASILIINLSLNSAIPTTNVAVYPVDYEDYFEFVEAVPELTRNGHARFVPNTYVMKRGPDFLGSRGKKSENVDFFGMRGKKSDGVDFFGMRGKKDGPDFLGMYLKLCTTKLLNSPALY